MSEWKTVPVTPNEEMTQAMRDAFIFDEPMSGIYRAGIAAAPQPSENHTGKIICDALGFDPTNHHNAAKCPYCTPPTEPDELARLERELAESLARKMLTPGIPTPETDEAAIIAYRYFELRGLLERHPERPELVRVITSDTFVKMVRGG